MRIFLIIILLLVSVILLLCLESTKRSYDSDIWFHLEYGKHYVEHHTLSIDDSVFSWTPATSKWPYVTWVGSSTIYIIYKYISLAAVMLLPFITLIAVFLVYILFLRTIGSSYSFVTMALFFIAALFFYLPVVKPAIFTSLLFAVCLAVYYTSRNNRTRIYWAYPLLFLLWVNTHGGFIFGLIFLCLAFSAELFISWRRHMLQTDSAYLRGFGSALLLSFLVLGINPLGFGYLTGIYQEITNTGGVDPAKHIAEYVNLWQKLNPVTNLMSGLISMSWAGVFMFALYALFSLLRIKRGHRPDFVSIFTLIFFFVIGMLYFRLFSFYSMVWLFSITSLIATEYSGRVPIKIALPIIGTLIYFAVNHADVIRISGEALHPFKHDIERVFPVKAAQFLIDQELPAPFINNYNIGGYLMWSTYPKYKVFCDGRYWPYQKPVIEDTFSFEQSKTPAEIKVILAKYPQAQTIFLQLGYTSAIYSILHIDDWRLIYFDDQAVIFVHKSSPKSKIHPDFNANRFSGITSPTVLMNLNKLYLLVIDHKDARIIRDIYNKNVAVTYLWRDANIKIMDRSLEGANGTNATNSAGH